MSKTLNLKKRKWIGKREIIVMIAAVVLTAAGIKASDSIFNQQDQNGANTDGCPSDMVFAPSASGGICIDRYEASAGPACPNQNPLTQADSRTNLDYRECLPVSEKGNIPWRFISQDQAAAACSKVGKRLATGEEWLSAALGTPDKESGWGADDCQVSNNWDVQPGMTGSAKSCYSSAGAFDMVGNVWEWVKDTVIDGEVNGRELPEAGFIYGTDGSSWPAETDPNTPDKNYNDDYFWIKKSGVRGVARGGYYANGSDAGSYAMYIVTPPSFAGVGVGFRCAK